MFLTVAPFFYAQERIAPFAQLLFFKEWHERFDPVTLYKIATVCDLLKKRVNRTFAQKNEWIAQKTDSRIPNNGQLWVFYKYYVLCT